MLWAKEIDKHTLLVNCDEGHGRSWEQGSISVILWQILTLVMCWNVDWNVVGSAEMETNANELRITISVATL